MIIPSKIRIGGQDVSIVNEERLDDDILGKICLAEGVLHIADNFSNRKQSESSKINTFIHEVVHGVLDTMGEFELSKNEKFVCAFASLLVDPIEDIINANNGHSINEANNERWINVWHYARVRPKDNSEILIKWNIKGNSGYESYYTSTIENWEKFLEKYGVSRWAYISDLLPKQFGNSEQLKRDDNNKIAQL